MVECCIRIALGEHPDITQKFNKGSAIRYFEQHNGIVVSVSGIDSAKAIKGVSEVFLSIREQQQVSDVNNSASRIGFVIAQGDTAHDAVHTCNQAMKEIVITIGE